MDRVGHVEARMDRLLLRPDEVADLLGIGRSKTYELIAAGDLPAVRVGKRYRIPAEALRAWVEHRSKDLRPAPRLSGSHTNESALDAATSSAR